MAAGSQCPGCSSGIVAAHQTSLASILADAGDPAKRNPTPPGFRQRTICDVITSTGLKSHTVEMAEAQYESDHPDFRNSVVSFPHGPLYYDKLANTEPYSRAVDKEKQVAKWHSIVPMVKAFATPVSMSEGFILDRCVMNVMGAMQPLFDVLTFKNKAQTDTFVTAKIKNKAKGRISEIKDTNKQSQALVDLKNFAIQMTIHQSLEGNKDLGNYENRIGEMGEFLFMVALKKACEENPGHPFLIITGYRLSKYLFPETGTNKGKGSLHKLGIQTKTILGQNIKKYLQERKSNGDAEHDILVVTPNGVKTEIIFCQAKVITESEEEEVKIEEKLKYSLKQTRVDILGLLSIFPDLSANDIANKLTFKVFSVLPMVTMNSTVVQKFCQDCLKIILLRDDINPNMTDNGTVAETLHQDIITQASIKNHTSLIMKLGWDSLKTATLESLDMLKTISTRYVGLGSLFPAKDYATFLQKVIIQLEKLDQDHVRKVPEKALYLSPDQVSAVQTFKMILMGVFGTGKTTVLETMIDRIIASDPQAMIYLVIWDDAPDLLARFEEKFPAIVQSGNLKVLKRRQLCVEFGAPDDVRQRAVTISTVCQALETKQQQTGRKMNLLVDELPPNKNHLEADNGDWSELYTESINVVLSMKPSSDKWSSNHLVMVAPSNLPIITLHRVYRCTQSVMYFISFLLKELVPSGFIPPLSFPLPQVTSGHEILGDLPEIVALPKCRHYSCSTPVSCLLKPHKATLQALLARLRREGVQPQHIVLIVSTANQEEESQKWLQREVAGKDGVRVKMSRQEFRGMEAEVVFWIGEGWGDTLLDSCTRATARLVMAIKTWGEEDEVMPVMLQAIVRGWAKQAEEQKGVIGDPNQNDCCSRFPLSCFCS